MKNSLFYLAVFLLPFAVQTMEYEIQFENEDVRISKWKLESGEEVGLHRDEYPQVVIAVEGGTIRRFEQDGTTTDVVFPKGIAVHRSADPIGELHRSVNSSNTAIEAFSFEFKKP